MRVGQNPAKFVKEVAKPERITVAVLSCIPFLSGFYAESLEVLKVCLRSTQDEPGLPFDLMVFDNGSCAEVQDWLLEEQRAERIQYLILSKKNLGKGGAWNMMLSGAPGEYIVYADSDVLFRPGWLKRCVDILETFPNVGMVTARPYRTSPDFYASTVAWGEADAEASVERGHFIPYEVFREFDLSLGQTEEEIRQRYDSSEDVRLTYRGVQAIAGASHWQFLARKDTLAQFLPFNMQRPMGQVRQLDQRVNDAGLLRLMPTEPLAMNMSNTLRGLNQPPRQVTGAARRSRLLDLPPVRRLLLTLYDSIFRWYYDRR
ncbi:MAG: glycosyltransferase family A protein [Chloroflexota bacterium]